MRVSFKTLMAAGLALAGSMIVQPVPAEAQPYWGHHYGAGWGYRPYAFAPRPYLGPRYYGYRSAYYGPRRYYGYPYRSYRRPNGGAVVAGLIGGLALGAIASAAANPYYYAPAYYAPPRCFLERRRIVTPYGRVIVRRVETCY